MNSTDHVSVTHVPAVVARTIISNNTRYFNTFSSPDWFARGIFNKINPVQQYISNINASVVDPSAPEIRQFVDTVTTSINDVERKLRSLMLRDRLDKNWFDVADFNTIEWRIIYTRGELYESGYPHTVAGEIVVNIDNEASMTPGILFHEKIHIYQRLRRAEYAKFVSDFGYSPIYYTPVLLAANPDNPTFDLHERNGDLSATLYTSQRPGDVLATDEPHQKPPYEQMAYLLQRIFDLF